MLKVQLTFPTKSDGVASLLINSCSVSSIEMLRDTEIGDHSMRCTQSSSQPKLTNLRLSLQNFLQLFFIFLNKHAVLSIHVEVFVLDQRQLKVLHSRHHPWLRKHRRGFLIHFDRFVDVLWFRKAVGYQLLHFLSNVLRWDDFRLLISSSDLMVALFQKFPQKQRLFQIWIFFHLNFKFKKTVFSVNISGKVNPTKKLTFVFVVKLLFIDEPFHEFNVVPNQCNLCSNRWELKSESKRIEIVKV